MEKKIQDFKSEIEKLISEHRTKTFICKTINCNYRILQIFLKENNISYSGNTGEKGYKKSNNKIGALEYIERGRHGSYVSSYKLKNKLIEDKIKENKCEKCKNIKWLETNIPLELHHKDGNRHNNELENLEILCPNCHALTNNYCSKNRKSYVAFGKIKNKKFLIEKIKKIENICDCGTKIDLRSKNCHVCSSKKLRKTERPSYLILKFEIKKNGYVATGKKYGVSDNSIRKWIKKYEEKSFRSSMD